MNQTAWCVVWLYLAGFCLILGLYTAAWWRADPPIRWREVGPTLLLVVFWPTLVVWAIVSIVQAVIARSEDR